MHYESNAEFRQIKLGCWYPLMNCDNIEWVIDIYMKRPFHTTNNLVCIGCMHALYMLKQDSLEHESIEYSKVDTLLVAWVTWIDDMPVYIPSVLYHHAICNHEWLQYALFISSLKWLDFELISKSRMIVSRRVDWLQLYSQLGNRIKCIALIMGNGAIRQMKRVLLSKHVFQIISNLHKALDW